MADPVLSVVPAGTVVDSVWGATRVVVSGEPTTVRLTPGRACPNWSNIVTTIVAGVTPSAASDVVDTVTVEFVADADGFSKWTRAWLGEMVTLSVVSVAVKVTSSAVASDTVKVAFPLESVTAPPSAADGR